MKLTNRFALAALAGVTALGGLAAAPAAARTSVSIEYRDRDYRGDHRNWRDDRRYGNDRRDYRDYRGYGRGYGYYGYEQRCWTEWHSRGRYGSYPVRVCR